MSNNIRISDLEQVAASTTAKLLIEGVFPFSQKNVSDNDNLTTYKATFQQLLDLFTALNSSTYILPPGLIMPYGGESTAAIKPLNGWKPCNGAQLLKEDYSALFAVIGDTYGGAASDTRYFKLPDLRGRTLIGAGQGTNLQNYTRGSIGGAEAVGLVAGHIPYHTHTYTNYKTESITMASGSKTETIRNGEQSQVTGAPSTTNANTTGDGHANMQPYTVINYIIKT